MPLTADDVKIKRTYWGTGIADDIEQGAQNLMIGAATKVQEMAQDQEGVVDDALRLVGGGIKNVQAAAADQEGWGDDALRLMGGGIGNTLRILGAAGEAGGWPGGKAAGALGVDPRIGGAIGGVVGDLVPLGGAVRALKIGKTAQRMSRLTKQGHGLQLDHILKIGKGQPYGFAYGDAGKLGQQKAGLIDAITASGKTRGKIKNLSRQADAAIQAKPTVSPELNRLPKDVDLNPLLKETTDIRDATNLRISKGKGSLDQIESAKSTVADLSQLKNDPRVYNSKKFRILMEKTEAQIDGAPALEWHHKNMKTLTRPFMEKGEALIKAGKATEADILNLGYIAMEEGVGMGDRMSALIQIPRIAHSELHTLMRAAGIEPTGAALKAYKANIGNIDNIDDLTRAFTKQINNISGPMTKEAKLLNKAMEGVDDRLLERFAGLTAERFTLRQLRTKLKKGLDSSSRVMIDRSANRLAQLEKRIKEIEALRSPVKKQVLQVLREKRKIISSPRRL